MRYEILEYKTFHYATYSGRFARFVRGRKFHESRKKTHEISHLYIVAYSRFSCLVQRHFVKYDKWYNLSCWIILSCNLKKRDEMRIWFSREMRICSNVFTRLFDNLFILPPLETIEFPKSLLNNELYYDRKKIVQAMSKFISKKKLFFISYIFKLSVKRIIKNSFFFYMHT